MSAFTDGMDDSASNLETAIRDEAFERELARAVEIATRHLPPAMLDELTSLRLALGCYRLANDQLTAENARLRAGLELVRLDGDDNAWIITAGTVKADLLHERECTSQLYALNCQLAARLEDLRTENKRLRKQLGPDVNYLDWI